MACRQPGFDSRRVHLIVRSRSVAFSLAEQIVACSTTAGAEIEQWSGRLGFVSHPTVAERVSITYGAGDGYGWPGRVANSIAARHEGSNPFPSALHVLGACEILLWW